MVNPYPAIPIGRILSADLAALPTSAGLIVGRGEPLVAPQVPGAAQGDGLDLGGRQWHREPVIGVVGDLAREVEGLLPSPNPAGRGAGTPRCRLSRRERARDGLSLSPPFLVGTFLLGLFVPDAADLVAGESSSCRCWSCSAGPIICPQQGAARGEDIPDNLLFTDAESKDRAAAYWIDRRLTGLAGPDYDAAISFGLPYEPEDSQYGKYRPRCSGHRSLGALATSFEQTC